MNKKNVLIGIIVFILVMISVVGVIAGKVSSLIVPDEVEEKNTKTLTYMEDTPYVATAEELEREEEIRKSTEENDKKVAQAHKILKKYNPDTFDYVYNTMMEKNSQGLKREPESIDEEAYTMLLDTYDNPELTHEEKEILEYAIIGSEEHIKKIPSLVTRLEGIINE